MPTSAPSQKKLDPTQQRTHFATALSLSPGHCKEYLKNVAHDLDLTKLDFSYLFLPYNRETRFAFIEGLYEAMKYHHQVMPGFKMHLDLSYNTLTNEEASAFMEMLSKLGHIPDLTFVDLSHNKLDDSLGHTSFSQHLRFFKVKLLDFSHNGFYHPKNLIETFRGINIKRLDLSNNKLALTTNFAEEFKNTKIEELDLSNCFPLTPVDFKRAIPILYDVIRYLADSQIWHLVFLGNIWIPLQPTQDDHLLPAAQFEDALDELPSVEAAIKRSRLTYIDLEPAITSSPYYQLLATAMQNNIKKRQIDAAKMMQVIFTPTWQAHKSRQVGETGLMETNDTLPLPFDTPVLEDQSAPKTSSKPGNSCTCL